jgi:ubiquinone/menaquinone biosynthesis C-methylase UbiE
LSINIETLTILNQFQDFIDNIKTVADMGCGEGNDALWWATLTNDNGKPRDIKINAIDQTIDRSKVIKHPNISYRECNLNNTGLANNSHDFVWAYNSLQYSLSPLHTLSHWWAIMKVDAMLLVTVPYNFSVDNHRDILKVDSEYQQNCYFNWTLGNLIMSLVITGFDCRNSYFKIDKQQKYIQAAVYKLPQQVDINMNWYQLCDKKMLPLCVEEAIMKNGNFKDTDITCEWIDRTQYILRV